MRSRTALAVGLLARHSSRAMGRGAGAAAPGAIALRLAPDLLASLAQGRRAAVVSATNGKTTTTRMLSAALGTQAPVLTNGEGSNLARGVLSTLMTDWRSRVDTCVFEVDELALAAVAAAIEPQLYVLGNLSRDQLDRMVEVRVLGERWARLLTEAGARADRQRRPPPIVVANCDDPHVAAAVPTTATGEPLLPTIWVAAGQPWAADAGACPRCSSRWSSLSDYHCDSCGFRRPSPTWSLAGGDLQHVDGQVTALDLALPGRANRANASLAIAAAAALGVPPSASLPAVRAVTAVAGRYSQVSVAGAEVRLLLAKNPAGWMEMLALNSEDHEPGGRPPLVLVLNAQGPDGRDTSWIWDVPFELLTGRTILICGERAEDLALRCRYADLTFAMRRDPLHAIEELAGEPGTARIDLLANYTAFESVRRRLAARPA